VANRGLSKAVWVPLAWSAHYFGPFLFLLFRADGDVSVGVADWGATALVFLWWFSAAFWQVLVLACWPTEIERQTLEKERILLFVVDDLDRCVHSKVVDILSLLNTVFQQNGVRATNDSQVHERFCVVVLGDDGWIADAYAKSMKDSSADSAVGWSFVAKLFDLVVRVPKPGKAEMEKMLEKQLRKTLAELPNIDGEKTEPIATAGGSTPATIAGDAIGEKSESKDLSVATSPQGNEPQVSHSENTQDDVESDSVEPEDRAFVLNHLLAKDMKAANGNPRAVNRAIISFAFWNRLRANWSDDQKTELAHIAICFASEPGKVAKCLTDAAFPEPPSPAVWDAIGGRTRCHPKDPNLPGKCSSSASGSPADD
jgi:KAP family P-loop domain